MANERKQKITIDVDTQSIKFANEEVLTLTQRARILKKELETPGKYSDEQIQVLRKGFQDYNDELEKSKIQNREFFGIISALPGPVGQFSNALDGGIDTLKTFTSFKMDDLKKAFGGVIGDVKEIGKNLLNLTGIQKVYEASTAASEKVLKFFGMSADNATKAAKGFGLALTSIGIGAAIFGIYKLVEAFNSLSDAQKTQNELATKIADNVADEVSLLQKLDTAIKNGSLTQREKNTLLNEYNEKLGETFGKVDSWKQLEDKLIANLPVYTQYLQKKAEAEAAYAIVVETNKKIIEQELMDPASLAGFYDVWSEGGILGFFIEGRKGIGQNMQKRAIANLNKTKNDAQAIFNKANDDFNKIAEDLKLPVPEVKGSKGEKTKKDLSNYLEQLKDLEKKYAADRKVIEQQSERDRQIQQKKNQAQSELDQVNELAQRLKGVKGIEERVAALRKQITENSEKEIKDLKAKFREDDLKKQQEYLDRTLELQIQVYGDNVELQEKFLNEKLQRDIKAYNKEIDAFNALNKDIQISAEQRAEYITLLQKATADKIQKIRDDSYIKLIQGEYKSSDSYLKALDATTEEAALRIEKFISEGKIDELYDYMMNPLSEEGMTRFDSPFLSIFKVMVNGVEQSEQSYVRFTNLVDLYKIQANKIRETEEKRQADAQKLFEEGKLSQEAYANFIVESNQKIVDSVNKVTKAEIDNNNLRRDSENALLDLKVQNFEKASGLIGAFVEIQDANLQRDQARFDEQLALYDKDSIEYANILEEKRRNEEEHLRKMKALQIAQALLDAGVAIARIIIDTQRAIFAFKASVAALGPVGAGMATAYAVQSKVSAALAIATITAQGIARIKNISSQQASTQGPSGTASNNFGVNYEKGGLIGGRRHAQGGTIIEAEQGEAIMTRGAVTMFAPMLSAMNQMGGGVSFSSNLVTRPDNPAVLNPALAQQPMIMKTYVVESELTNEQQKQARLKDLSTL